MFHSSDTQIQLVRKCPWHGEPKPEQFTNPTMTTSAKSVPEMTCDGSDVQLTSHPVNAV